MERPDVSVLVPVYNEAAVLRETAERILGQRFSGSFEVLFVDGGSDDGTREVLADIARSDPRVRLLENPAREVPAALNVGLDAARGELIARMDAHTHYPLDYLERGVERLAAGDVDWVSGAALPRGADRGSRRVALALGTWLGAGGAAFRRPAAAEFETDTGFTGIIRRAVLEAHGGWDEGSVVNEDAELATRIRAAGGRIVCVPELAAAYVPRSSLPALARQYWRYGHYRARTARLHPASLRRSHALPPLLVAALAAAPAPGPLRRPARAALAVYAMLVAGESARSGDRSGSLDAFLLPAVFVTMHVAWGLGFVAGAVRFGLRPPRPASRSPDH